LQFVVMKFLRPRESSADRLQVTSVTFCGFQRKSSPVVRCFFLFHLFPFYN